MLIFLTLTLFWNMNAQASETVIHPPPKDPTFVQADRYAEFKAKVLRPPRPGSAAQAADEKELLKVQTTRTSDQCKRAESEVKVSVKSFFAAPYGNLTDEEAERLQTFFEQVRNDADYFIQRLKKDFPRKRPFLYVAGLNPCVQKEVTGAYPSGHATIAKLYALILKDLYPDRAEAFLKRAQTIAEDRVLAGMHHPSDIRAGGELGGMLYEDFKQSKKFKEVFSKSRAQ